MNTVHFVAVMAVMAWALILTLLIPQPSRTIIDLLGLSHLSRMQAYNVPLQELWLMEPGRPCPHVPTLPPLCLLAQSAR